MPVKETGRKMPAEQMAAIRGHQGVMNVKKALVMIQMDGHVNNGHAIKGYALRCPKL